MNALANIVFAVIFLVCTVVFSGFVLVSWLGWTLGLLWTGLATLVALFVLWRFYASISPGGTESRGEGERGHR